MTEDHSIEARLLELVAECAPKGSPPEGIRPEMSLRRDLGLDSVQLLLLVHKFEEEFGVELPSSALGRGGMTTVDELVAAGREFLEEGAR